MITEHTRDPMMRLIERLRILEADVAHVGHFEPHEHPDLYKDLRFMLLCQGHLIMSTVERLETQGWSVVHLNEDPMNVKVILTNVVIDLPIR